MKNKKLNLKSARLSAVVVLSLCMLCANPVKTYAQVTLSFTPSDGSTLTYLDIMLQLKEYASNKVYEMGHPYNAYTEAQQIDEVAFHLQPVVSISAPKVIDIGFRAFSGGIIAKVDLPSVKFIGKEAFMLCNSLTEIYLPSCLLLFDGAFNECKNMTDAGFPMISEVPRNTFTGCTALESIEIPNVKTIFTSAFSGCTKLSTSWYELAPVGAWFELNASDIFEYAFRGCKSIKKLSCPNLKYVYEASFNGCSGITELNLPVATKIESEAFGECSSLQKLSLPATEVIDRFAFIDCTGLTELALPKIKTIGAYAFSGCPNIWKVSFGKGHTEAQIITLSEQIFGTSGTRAGGNVNPANIEIEIGENVLPQPTGNSWNGITWKKVTVVPAGTGIEEVKAVNTLSVYPNPVTERLYVSTAAATEYILYNSTGQMVMTGQLPSFGGVGGGSSMLNIEFLPRGMYSIFVGGQTAKFLKK